MAGLQGKRIVITRGIEDYESTAEAVKRRGGTPIACPTIQIVPVDDCRELDQAIQRLAEFDWLLFTSAHSVHFFCERWKQVSAVDRPFTNVRIGAIGPSTAVECARHALPPDFVAETSTGQAFFDEFQSTYPVQGKRFLVPVSNLSKGTLPNGLKEAGGEVTVITAYRNQPVRQLDPGLVNALKNRQVDWVLFFSPSAASNYFTLVQKYPEIDIRNQPKSSEGPPLYSIASIGPSTSQMLRSLGVEPEVEASPHTVEGLLDCLD